VVCTHAHADHVTGLVEVLQRYGVRQVLEPGIPYETPIYQEWLRLIEIKGIEYNIARARQEIELGNGIRLEVLNPPESLFEGTGYDVDNNGVVLRLSWGQISFLSVSDVGEEVELELIQQRSDLRSTVLKVAHHGSDTSTSRQFLAAVDPELAVICVGVDNSFGHPNSEVVVRLVDAVGRDSVYRTDEDGTIEFITDGESLWVKTDS